MKSRPAFILTSILALAALIATAFAQVPEPPRGVKSADNLSAQSGPYSSPYQSGPYSSPYQSGSYSSSYQSGADPALKQLETDEGTIARQTDVLIRQLETADSDSRRNDIKAKLGEALGKQFDVRQKRHGLEIGALEAQVKKLRELVEKRQENRVEIIARRLDQIVRESQGLGF